MNPSRIDIPTNNNLETIKSWIGCYIRFCDRQKVAVKPYAVREGLLLSVGTPQSPYGIRVMQPNGHLYQGNYGWFEWIEISTYDPED